MSMVPSSIASDCTIDVTSALQQWLDQVSDGGIIAFGHNRCYRIEKTLKLARRHNLLVDGNGSTLRASTPGAGGRLAIRNRAHLAITASTNITVRNLKVHGANPHGGATPDAYDPRYEAQHAFQLNGDDGVFLDHVSASDVYGDFVYIGGSQTQPSQQITVAHSTFARSGRQGVSVTNGEDVLIVGNKFDGVARSLLDLEPNIASQEARRIRFVSNTSGDVMNYWLADKGVGPNVGDFTATDNVMQKPSGALVIVVGPLRARRGPFTFERNVLQTTGAVNDENALGAFLFENTHNVVVRNNQVRVLAAHDLAGVEVRTSADVTVDGNRFSGTSKPLVHDAASSGLHGDAAP
jgi:hypothetical protein